MLEERKKKEQYFSYNPLNLPHPLDESIFKSAKSEIDRYLSFKLNDRLFGKEIKISPSFLANSIKYISKFNVIINDGEITESNNNVKTVLSSYALIGENYRGGYGYERSFSLPLNDNIEALKRNFWFSNFLAIKEAYKRYSSLFGGIEKARRQYDILSREDKIVDICKEENINEDEIINKINTLIDALREVSKKIGDHPEIYDAVCEINIKRVLHYFINSEGTRIKTSNFYIWINISGELFDSYGSLEINRRIYKRNFDINIKDIKKYGDDIIQTLIETKDCRRQEAGVYPLLLDGSAHGVIWHEGVGHLLEKYPSDPETETEVFVGKIGKKIAPSFINVECDPTLPDGYGSYKYDDEGIRGKKVVLIEKGILKDFLHSRLTAGRYRRRSNGHGRCEDEEADSLPEPRMSNLIVKSSQNIPNNLLKRKLIEIAIKKGKNYGIYCKGFNYGLVEIENGKNEIHPLETFRVYVNGKVERVKDIYIIGTPYMLINKLVFCGKDIEIAGGYCGAESGDIPVEERAPPAIFEDIEFARETKRNERRPFLSKP